MEEEQVNTVGLQWTRSMLTVMTHLGHMKWPRSAMTLVLNVWDTLSNLLILGGLDDKASLGQIHTVAMSTSSDLLMSNVSDMVPQEQQV